MTNPGRRVIASAGHVDHGKSSLIRALTGTDPDRLEEEKRRGMTIDLGFARLDLPGLVVGVVDVPGHARFIRNMLAGAHGLDAALLVVALDEGVMPQTREHLEILSLLGVRAGVVALTKLDLVEAEWVEVVGQEVQALLEGTPLAGAPMVPVSSTSGEGLDDLRLGLAQVLAQAAPSPERGVHLPIDRAFVRDGLGVVVTGTLSGGTLERGQELLLYPQRITVRVRDLQEHGASVARVGPGSRAAVNLQGVDRVQVSRGHLLAGPDTVAVTSSLDAEIRVGPGQERILKNGARLRLHLGAAEVGARLRIFGAGQIRPGERAWVRLGLDQVIAARTGDRFVVRFASPSATVGGGQVADPTPGPGRADPDRLAARLGEDLEAAVEAELGKHPLGAEPATVSASLGLRPGRAREVLQRLAALGRTRVVGRIHIGSGPWQILQDRALRTLVSFHRAHPGRPGMARAELASQARIPIGLLGVLLEALADGRVAHSEQEAWLLEGAAGRDRALEVARQRLRDALGESEFAPPSAAELVAAVGGEAPFRSLVQAGSLVRLEGDLYFSRDAYEKGRSLILAHLAKNRELTVAQARDLLGTTRRYVLPFLGRLDADHVTRRVGETRVLRQGSS